MKIYIVGSVASGKTTLAKKLSKQLAIDYFEADCIAYHQTTNGRVKRSPEEQVQEIMAIDACGEWIIEGVYRREYHCLLALSDKIIFLDTPLWVRNYRIVTRFIKQQLQLEACEYHSDIQMLQMMFKWTKDFENKRNHFETMLSTYENKLVKIKTTSIYKDLISF
ncbi:DNA topology modulation protein FlaR [Enterococcus diestrammenae]|uniref:DNA topology modulation protein FlaR n=1 Tax=Enterococcus diestrammenae TaxID=1155073 RepID=A0ABV0F262_9ENTE|nr:DNA topology modulation protein FlaR [Enterococcus diestrammenae]